MTKIPSYVRTFDTFIGSGALSYPWWQVDESPSDWINVEPGWRVILSEVDPEEGETTGETIVVTHKGIIEAIHDIVGAPEVPKYMNLAALDECEAFLEDHEEADFDSDLADQVLQYMMFGEIVYG